MKYEIRKMTEKNTIEVLTWKYEKPYDFYNHVLTFKAILELLNVSYKTIHIPNGDLIGYFCTGKSARVPNENYDEIYPKNYVDVGVGMKPDFTGQGNGTDFFSTVLGDVEENNPQTDIRLTVASFNKRAIHLYEKFGFIKAREFSTKKAIFITMVKRKISSN